MNRRFEIRPTLLRLCAVAAASVSLASADARSSPAEPSKPAGPELELTTERAIIFRGKGDQIWVLYTFCQSRFLPTSPDLVAVTFSWRLALCAS